MLPDDWSVWARTFRKRPLWEPAASTQHVSLGRTDIERLIPHRPPFLLIDGITAIDVEQSAAQAYRVIDPADPVFAGHFPGDPIYPGMLQLEMAGQLSVWLAEWLRGAPAGGGAVRAIKVHHAVFAAAVLPGDHVEVLAKILVDDGTAAVAAGQVRGARGIAAITAMELYRVES